MGFDFIKKLPTPEEIRNQYPIDAEIQAVKDARDKELRDVFTGKSDKFLAIIGPCSADNEDAVLDYLTRLRNVQEKIADKVLIVPRVYTNKPTQDSEFCKIDTTFIKTSKVNRRFIIGKNLEENSCTEKFTSNELGINGDNDFLITKSINKIRKQGGGNRFVHGGATLQELVVPLLEIKYHRKNMISEVEATIMPISTITTNNVNVSVYQEEPISERIKPITISCGFYSEDGIELSDKHKITLNSSDDENRNRENKLKFTFKEISNKYSGKFIKFVMKKVIENSSEEPIYKTYDVKLQLAFFNDFDEL